MESAACFTITCNLMQTLSKQECVLYVMSPPESNQEFVVPTRKCYMEYSVDDNNVSQKRPDEHRDLQQDHLAIDTTDDEQEDLPYDGILECYLVPSVPHCNVDKSDIPSDSHQALINIEESQTSNSPIQTETTNDDALYSLDSSKLFSLSETLSNPVTELNEDTEEESENILTVPTIIPDVLLRHISEGTLVNPSEFIDYETMPEMSIFESSDETAIGRKIEENLRPHGGEQEDFKDEYLELYQKKNNEVQENLTHESNSDVDETSVKGSDAENDPELIQEEADEFLPDEVDIESKQPIYEPHRQPSYEMKYGQGQVHYKLPDFSKVPPKVKIPKGDNGAAKSKKKTVTSTNFIGQSFLIRDILDSMQPIRHSEQMKEDRPCLDQRNEQVLIDSNINRNVDPGSPPASEYQFLGHVENQSAVVYFGLRGMRKSINKSHKFSSMKTINDSVFSVEMGLKISGSEEAMINETQKMECAQIPTEGEKMTGLLEEQAQTLKIKVFQNFKSCLETLEMDYLSTKEKHRNLQLQTYRRGSQTVGEFDREREVEGQIFRLGILLEDIQEQIQKSEDNETESVSSNNSGEVLALSLAQETEDINDLVPNNNTDNTVTCVNQMTRMGATVISSDIVPLMLSGQLCNSKGQNGFSQVECPEEWIVAEHTKLVEERQMNRKLKQDIRACPVYLRYEEDEMRKTQRQFRKPRNVSIFVQEESVDLDMLNLSSSTLKKKYSTVRTPTSERHSKELNPNTFTKEYPKQKSSWPSRLPLCAPNQSSLFNRLGSNVGHYVPSSRCSVQSSVSSHSQLATLTLQRQRWKNVKQNNLDYRDHKILNYVLDNALRTAKNMKRTTERMVQKLATDSYRVSYTM
ncbi:protein AKNAD1 [Leptodactylus fuscus]